MGVLLRVCFCVCFVGVCCGILVWVLFSVFLFARVLLVIWCLEFVLDGCGYDFGLRCLRVVFVWGYCCGLFIYLVLLSVGCSLLRGFGDFCLRLGDCCDLHRCFVVWLWFACHLGCLC